MTPLFFFLEVGMLTEAENRQRHDELTAEDLTKISLKYEFSHEF